MTIVGTRLTSCSPRIIMQHLTGDPASVPADQLCGAAFRPVTS
jgi:hypothetical protein